MLGSRCLCVEILEIHLESTAFPGWNQARTCLLVVEGLEGLCTSNHVGYVVEQILHWETGCVLDIRFVVLEKDPCSRSSILLHHRLEERRMALVVRILVVVMVDHTRLLADVVAAVRIRRLVGAHHRLAFRCWRCSFSSCGKGGRLYRLLRYRGLRDLQLHLQRWRRLECWMSCQSTLGMRFRMCLMRFLIPLILSWKTWWVLPYQVIVWYWWLLRHQLGR